MKSLPSREPSDVRIGTYYLGLSWTTAQLSIEA